MTAVAAQALAEAGLRGKIEGLSRDVRDPRKVHFVIDDDDETVPSEIFDAVLNERFFPS